MAHEFLKKMLEPEDHSLVFRSVCCLTGTFLWLNSFVAQWCNFTPELVALLALLGSLLLGLPLVGQALADLFKTHSDMNELAALSFLAAWVSGQYQTAGAIAFFMIISLLIEYRSEVGARKNLEALLRLTPQKAQKVIGDAELTVTASELHPQDRVRVRPGDKIPADGVIISGVSCINEASITGESLPIEKSSGMNVFAGSINVTGVLELEVTKSTSDSTIAQIKKLMVEAGKSQNKVMQLLDSCAGYYTPVILMISALTLFFTYDIDRAIAILIIACPCTVLLSIPSAKIAALSAAASLGVIIKDIGSIETAARLDSFVFDKTGTLTTGHFKVVKLNPAPGIRENELLATVAAVEFNSKHPIAQAVVELAEARQLHWEVPEEFEELSGYGVKSSNIICGNVEYLKKLGYAVPQLADTAGCSVLLAVQKERYMGAIYLADTPREDAKIVLQNLRQAGAEHVVMLTGDRWSSARYLAEQLDCELEAEVLPADKMHRVQALQESGQVVAVIGDGVNDAPALAAGDVSIAMGRDGSDIAINSAAVVLLGNRLNRISFFWELARRTGKIMRQNLGFSVIFILLMLILSIFGEISPLLAVLLHTGSALFIVTNSARLLRAGDKWL